MARLTAPDEGSRLVYRIDGAVIPVVGARAVFYSDAAGTTLADIRDSNGNAVASTLTVDAYSRLPLFQMPDGVDTVYVSVAGGPLTPVYARNDDRLDTLTANVATNTAAISAEATARAAADTAAALAASGTYLSVGTTKVDVANYADDLVAAVAAGPTAATYYLNKPLYQPSAQLTLQTGMVIEGTGEGQTVLQLPNGANHSLIKSAGYDGLAGGGTSGGIEKARLRRVILDGNKANNSSGAGLKYYGALLSMDDVIVRNFAEDGILTDWSSTAVLNDGCESVLTKVVTHDNGGNGITWGGSHDSIWTDCVSFLNTGKGYHIKQSASVHKAVNCHSWGGGQTYAWYIEGRTYLIDCEGEGAAINLMLGANHCQVIGGAFFGFQAAHKGVQIGDASHTGIVGTRLLTRIDNCQGGCLDLTYNGGDTVFDVKINSTGTGVVGTPAKTDHGALLIMGGASGFSGEIHTMGSTNTQGARWSNSSRDILNINSNNTRVELVQGALLRFYKDVYSTTVAEVDGTTGYVRPGTTTGAGSRIYSGSGVPGIAGVFGDSYIRTDTPGTVGQRLYMCTVTGAAGAATWVATAA